jgi:rubrerythrin
MRDLEFRSAEQVGDFVTFLVAGAAAKGEFHCAGCGYGVSVYRRLPRCPMCGGKEWERNEALAMRRASSTLS